MEDKTFFRPDFYIIPDILVSDTKLRPTDLLVYAVVYWLERLKDGKCTAGNETISNILKITDRGTQSSLQRLEERGYIQRYFTDENKKIREEIKTLVAYEVRTNVRTGTNKRSYKVRTNVRQISNSTSNSNKVSTNSDELVKTPVKELTQLFIDSVLKEHSITPKINYPQAGQRLKDFFKKYTQDDFKSLMAWYIKGFGLYRGYDFTSMLSAYTINKWQTAKIKGENYSPIKEEARLSKLSSLPIFQHYK